MSAHFIRVEHQVSSTKYQAPVSVPPTLVSGTSASLSTSLATSGCLCAGGGGEWLAVQVFLDSEASRDGSPPSPGPPRWLFLFLLASLARPPRPFRLCSSSSIWQRAAQAQLLLGDDGLNPSHKNTADPRLHSRRVVDQQFLVVFNHFISFTHTHMRGKIANTREVIKYMSKTHGIT